jgi:uncharacterized membrane-anchored protein YjiN (DUF445 family)
MSDRSTPIPIKGDLWGMSMMARADARRSGDLNRMRVLATGLLVLLTAIFLATRLAPASWVFAPYVQAFAEAGMVGACADWFAVTALFRRPLGLPIPHTAILPRSKARIGEALGDFIAHNFLDPRLLDEKLRRAEPARRLSGWLADSRNVDALSRRLAALAPELVRATPDLAELATSAVRRLAAAGPLAPLSSKILAYLWRDGGGQNLVDRALARLGDHLQAHPTLIQEGVEAGAWKWLPKWVDRIVAERLSQGLIRTLQDLRKPAHPARQELNAAIEDYIRRLSEDPELIASGEAVKTRLLNDPSLLGPLAAAWTESLAQAVTDPVALREAVAGATRKALAAIGAWLAEDQAARARFDLAIRVLLRSTLTPGRDAIGRFIAQIVSTWDADDVAARIEVQVGRDLQFIRINGALVGGVVGLAIYVGLRFFP